MPGVSILICTRNRAASLRDTLASLARCAVPPGLTAELVVIDNGSTDGTAAVVRAAALPNLPARYVLEPAPGQVHARNAGLRAAGGDVILFTDDDVRLPANWLAGMCAPILEDRADAVAGGVRFPPDYEALLSREPFASRRGWFASTDGLDPAQPGRMVGANMAFSRQVVERIGEFDPELGPGALGFFDETVYCWRLRQAGFRLGTALDVSVEHRFDRERLTRPTLLSMARRMGESEAWVVRHWQGGGGRVSAYRVGRAWALCRAERLRTVFSSDKGRALARELERVKTLAFWRQLRRYEGTPGKYAAG